MKLFVTSDIHGNFKALQKGLQEVGYDMDNPDHIFVSLGDNFDRGADNVAVYNFLRSIPAHKRVLIRGNHEEFLLWLIQRGRPLQYDYYNHTVDTVYDLAQSVRPTDLDHIVDVAKETGIHRWINEEMGWFAETPSYIFVHGSVPRKADLSGYETDLIHFTDQERWVDAACCKTPDIIDWHRQTYPNGYDKTIVFGHWGNFLLRGKTPANMKPEDHLPWYDTQHKLIGLDSTSVLSDMVNVIVLEENVE